MKRVIRHAKKLKELKIINNILTIIVFGLGLYIMLVPFLPALTFWVKEESPVSQWTSQVEEVEAAADSTIGSDRLFIPKLGLEEVIFSGGAGELSKGVVRLKKSSTPNSGSNTVMVGHRFTYDDKGVFYHLDKLIPGDKISVHWFPEKYDYTVTKVFEVTPDATWVEDPTDESILTLYTCTPLWNPKNRLVVQARLEQI